MGSNIVVRPVSRLGTPERRIMFFQYSFFSINVLLKLLLFIQLKFIEFNENSNTLQTHACQQQQSNLNYKYFAQTLNCLDVAANVVILVV